MDTQRLAAILFLVSFLAIIGTTMAIPPELYATEDIDKRLEILEANRSRWYVERTMGVLFSLGLAGGFTLLASKLRVTGGTPWVLNLSTAAILGATIVGLYFVYLQTIDPRGGYSGAYPIPENLAYWLWLAGTLLFGIAFLQAGLPAWLGYLTVGAALVYGIVFLLTGAGFMTPFLVGFLCLPIGIVLLRQ